MLKQLKNRKQEGHVLSGSKGFTIIEVLIVLAIAGLILLIVFLAVPALQRNSRNTTIKNDVQNVVGGVSEFQGANGGILPTGITGTGTITYAGSVPTTISVQGTTQVVQKTVGTAVPTTGTGPANGEIDVYLKKDCQNGDNNRSVAAVYSIETTSNKHVLQCTSS